MIAGVFAIIVGLSAFGFFVAQAIAQTRGLTVELRTAPEATAPVAERIELYDNSYALVIGNDDYNNGWPKLTNAVADAVEVAGALKEQGFEVTLKENLDGVALRDTLKEFFAIKGTDPEARLLLWYAGHGHSIKGEGFLVPVDAPSASEPEFKLKALHMRDFGGLMRLAESKHVLAIFDSCFSGTIFTTRAGAVPAAITRVTAQPSRQFMTSGDEDQQVSDDGTFRRLFIRALHGETIADSNGDGYLTGTEIGLFMSTEMTNYTEEAQTPRYGKLRDPDYDRGDFVFALPGRLEAAEPRLNDFSTSTGGPTKIESTRTEITLKGADPKEQSFEDWGQGLYDGHTYSYEATSSAWNAMAPSYNRNLGVLILNVKVEQPGSIIDTIGIKPAPVGSFSLVAQEDGRFAWNVYAPNIDSEVRDVSGWHRFLSKPVSYDEWHSVEVWYGVTGTQFIVDGDPKVLLDFKQPLSGEQVFVGDFPFDKEWDPRYNAKTGFIGRVNALRFVEVLQMMGLPWSGLSQQDVARLSREALQATEQGLSSRETMQPPLEVGRASTAEDQLEVGIDRPGSDLVCNFPVSSAGECSSMCQGESACISFTWVKAGHFPQPPFNGNPICCLKDSVPAPIKNDCCVSGVKKDRLSARETMQPSSEAGGALPAEEQLEVGIDRPGSDLVCNFPVSSAGECSSMCQGKLACVSFTWVKAGHFPQPPFNGNPICCLKDSIPAPIKNDCCVSGVLISTQN